VSLQHFCLTFFPSRNPYGELGLPGEADDTGGVQWSNASLVPEAYQRIPDLPEDV